MCVTGSWCIVAHLICIFRLQQLTDSLLEMEEERAIWSAKEKASIEAMEEKSKLYNMEITSLTREMSEVVFISALVYTMKSFLASLRYGLYPKP